MFCTALDGLCRTEQESISAAATGDAHVSRVVGWLGGRDMAARTLAQRSQ